MPCYLLIRVKEVTEVQLDLDNMELARKAMDELSLVEGKDYIIRKDIVTLKSLSFQNEIKQHYGIIVAEREARRKGYRTNRKVQEDGAIMLTLSR